MKTRPFGKTGLEVSELALGGGAVGGLLIDAEEEVKHQVIDMALSAGINWIDTAPSYGQGRSEESLGRLLKKETRNPFISTKFTIDTRNPDIRGQIEFSLEASLQRLQRNSVTLLQIHNPIGPISEGRQLGLAEILKPHGVLDVLDDLRSQGMIHLSGITALGDTNAIIKVIKSNRIDSAQVYYNLLNPSAGFTPPPGWPCHNFTSIMDTCREHDVAIMNIRVFSAGVIATDTRTGKERPLTPGDTVESETEKAARIFSEIGTDYGTRAQTALRFALTQSKTATIIFGLANISHLQEALTGLEKGPLPDEAVGRIIQIYKDYR